MPVIGVTSEQSSACKVPVRQNYLVPFAAGGCAVVVIPSINCDYTETARRLAVSLDGIVLSGGGDVDPRFYGEEPLARLGSVSRERDEIEIALARAFLELDKPILGICRGCQVLNVAAGGSLVQDIRTQVRGSMQHRLGRSGLDGDRHDVRIEPETLLHGIFGRRRLEVNSRHHQAVRGVAPGFRATAFAEDGVIEAIEDPSRKFAVAVQWHPEDLYPGEDSAALFHAFIEKCREGAGCRP